MKELLEYKMDANDWGNLIHPNWIDHTDCGHFYNPSNYTYIGSRLCPQVKVPESVRKFTRQQLLDRAKIPGIMVKVERSGNDHTVTQMADEEIEIIVNQFCDERNID